MEHRERGRSRRFNYSNIMSTLSVFLVVSGGTALAVTAPKSSVNSKSVKNNALKSGDLKDGKAVSGKDVIDSSLSGADLGVNSLGGEQVDEASLNINQPSSLPPSGAAGGSLDGEYPNPALAAGSVGAGQLQDNAVESAKVEDGTITSNDVANQSLAGTDILNNSVTGDDVSGLTGADVTDQSLTGSDIENNTVNSDDVFGVQTQDIADGTLDAVDVGISAGRTNVDFGSVGANSCETLPIDTNQPTAGNSVLVTPGAEYFLLDLSVSGLGGLLSDTVNVNVCNPTAGAIDPPATDFAWVVFDN